MAYRDPFKMDIVPTLDKPYTEDVRYSGKNQQGTRVNGNNNAGSGGGGSVPVVQGTNTAQEQQKTGYVAPRNQLTMPKANSNYAAAPDPYASKWQSQIDDMMDKIMNREPFSYDLDGDMLYNQYKNQYQLLGRQAMADTMGQAAGLTGGYGSTYGQAAGQQAYDSYLQQLNDKIPELYALSRNAYDQEGQNLMTQYGMLGDRENQDYSRYQDDYSKWLTERSHQEERDDLAWNREYQFQKDSYDRQQDNYNKLAALISTYGYNPTDDELSDAGMSRNIADLMRNEWVSANTPKTTGGGYRGSPKKDDNNETEEQNAKQNSEQPDPVKDATYAFRNGASPDEVWKALYNAGVGGSQAWQVIKQAWGKK